MSKFQVVLLVIFGAFIVIAVMLFSFARGGSSSQMVYATVWGSIPLYDWNTFSNASGLASDKNIKITYVEKSRETISAEFTEALAVGKGPDLIILSQDQIWKEKNKLIPIPYESVSERGFIETFIEEGELFLTEEGVYALPLSVDPIVLYYNRDHLTKAGIPKPLEFWDEIYNQASKLSDKDPAGNMTKSAIALGESKNIPHYKEVLSLLMIQAGTPITAMTELGFSSVLSHNFNLSAVPAAAALDFYTQFSNPAKPFYSWNRSLLPADTHFTSGDTTYYLGFASELRTLRAKNPTLNFGVALVPQSRVSDKRITFGRLDGVAIVRGTPDPSGALTAALKIVSKPISLELTKTLWTAPARRDTLGEKPSDAVFSVFYDAALQSAGWLDPDDEKTRVIFTEMIDSVTSGRARVSEAVNKAQGELESLTN